MKLFKRNHDPVKDEKSRALIKERMSELRKVPAWCIEPLEVLSSFHFFYMTAIMLVFVFLFVGQGYFLAPERLIAFAVFLAIFAYVGKSLRELLIVDAFEIPEYANNDKLLAQTLDRISADNKHIHRIHHQIFTQYLDSVYSDETAK